MTELTLSKLNLAINNTVVPFLWNDDITIEVKQYLPMENKLHLINEVINNAVDNNGYYNDGKIEVYLAIGLIEYYTSIVLTNEDKQSICDLYDILESSGMVDIIKTCIPTKELEFIKKCLYRTIHSVYEYKNSAMGILEAIADNNDALELNTEKLQQTIGDSDNLSLLKEILTKIG